MYRKDRSNIIAATSIHLSQARNSSIVISDDSLAKIRSQVARYRGKRDEVIGGKEDWE